MPRKRTSLIWKASDEAFRILVRNSLSYGDILRHFGLRAAGSNWVTVRKRCSEDGIDVSHFNGQSVRVSFRRNAAIPLEQILVENSTYSRGSLKKRLLEKEILKNICIICGLQPFWNGQPLVLRLDHKNGINNDCRIQNLRLVCPNCDSQLPTFTGRNVNHNRHNCLDCGKILKSTKTKRCQSCNARHDVVSGKRSKISWPSAQELQEKIKLLNQNRVAESLGISEAALRKRIRILKKYNLWVVE